MANTFDSLLKNYADLTVKVGLNIQPGQTLIIQAPLEVAPLVRLIAATAYQCGAKLVDVMWRDDALILARHQYAPRNSFTEYPTWRSDGLLQTAQKGGAFLGIHAHNPDLLKDQDPEYIAIAQRAAAEHQAAYRAYPMRDAVNWSIIAAPIPAWAARVFPKDAPAMQLKRLWDAIFDVCRLKQADPVAAWQAHITQLAARCHTLNQKQYTALHLKGPGTDLTVGLPPNHIWKGGQSVTESGIKFVPNLPTDEVFTMPHKDRVNGTVTATKPLNKEGSMIEDFSLTFVEGKVVEVKAAQGETTLQHVLNTDDGARRLGEVALVPANAPVAAAGHLFYNTLFDENAASHLALGRAYRFTLAEGTTMTEDEFEAAGGNVSLTHVDFMVGSEKVDVDGITTNGTTEPLMRAGEWAFAVQGQGLNNLDI